MMRLITAIVISASLVSACGSSSHLPAITQSETSASGLSLELKWTLDGFEMPEGAALAANGDYYISNIAGDLTAKDGEGWISRLSPDGRFVEQFWATGLNAPKGMVVHEGALYVADIDTIIVLDPDSGERVNSIPIDGASFLNDMGVWRGELVVSDSSNSTVYTVRNGFSSILVELPEYAQLNGLLENREGELLITSMGSGALLSYDMEHGIHTIADGLNRPDGIGIAPDGSLLVSSFPGQVFQIGTDQSVSELLDTRRREIMQNDLSVFGDVVVIPNLQPGTVTAWQIQ
ncbi:MAG: hypothetical protein AAFV59_09910 [Pseudomonadota bacterium]